MPDDAVRLYLRAEGMKGRPDALGVLYFVRANFGAARRRC